MRSGILSLFGCIVLITCASNAQTPTIQPNGVVNAAGSGHSAVIAPGSLFSIFGSGLAAGLSVANSIPVSTTLGDVSSVTINGTAAPLVFVSNGQISAQAPWGAGLGPANVVVNRGGASSQPMAVLVNQFAPALFAMGFSTLQAIAANGDGTLTAPAGSIPGITSHPATAGDTITLYATGLGPVSPDPSDGANSVDTPRQTTTTPTVLMGSAPGSVSLSGLSPQFVGVYQLNVVVPGGVTGNAVPVQLQIADATSADAVTIALQ